MSKSFTSFMEFSNWSIPHHDLYQICPIFFPTDNYRHWAYIAAFSFLGCGFPYQTSHSHRLKLEAKGWILVKEDFNLGFLNFQLKIFCCHHLNHRHIFQASFLVGGGTQPKKILKLGNPPLLYFKSKITLYP